MKIAILLFSWSIVVWTQAKNPPNNPPEPVDGPYNISKFSNVDQVRPLAAAVAGDGSIVVLRQRVDPPIAVFNPDGRFLRGWGEGLFKGAHSISVDHEGYVWTTDNVDNTVYKFTMDGNLLLTLGKRGMAGDNSSQDAFDGPSSVAVSRSGDIFVTDGYRNSRVVKFSKQGKFIKIIGGTKGSEPGQFNLPHAALFDPKGRLIVTDRLNDRIEVFDQEGKFLEAWTDLGIRQPSGLYITPEGLVYTNDNTNDAFVVLKDGKPIETFKVGGRPHLFGVDRYGAIYEADAMNGVVKRIQKK